MSKSTFPTGAPMLDGAILTLLRDAQANGDPLNAASISLAGIQRFNDTFPELSQQEVDDALEWMAANEAPTAEPAEAEQQPDAEAQPVKAAPEISRDAAQENLRLAHDNLARARRDLMDCQRLQKEARGILSQKILAWQTGGAPPMTREELVRETLRSNQIEREQNGPNRRYARTATAFTQKQMVTGNARGSVPLIQLQRMRAAAARAKLPSER
jgi:hypothetical protein